MEQRKIKLYLAPMAGYTDSAFRQICREAWADVTVSEMVSADAIFYNKKIKRGDFDIEKLLHEDKTVSLMRFNQKERPFIVQLFGKDPEKFGFAAAWVTKNIKPDGIDINMGCPARKVVNSGHGSALMVDDVLACEIVIATASATDLPVSVKTRLGFEDENQILDFGPKLIEAGAKKIFVHGRTYKDGFKGLARWENIYRLKRENDGTEIVGNGDVKSLEEAKVRAENEGVILDGIMAGRAAFQAPWAFCKKEMSEEEIYAMAMKQAKLAFADKGEHGIIEFRKFLLQYFRGNPRAKEIRKKAVSVASVEDVARVIGMVE